MFFFKRKCSASVFFECILMKRNPNKKEVCGAKITNSTFPSHSSASTSFHYVPLFKFTVWFILPAVSYFCFVIHLLIKKYICQKQLEYVLSLLFIVALLRYNSQNVQFTCLKCSSVGFTIFTELCSHHYSQFQSIFITHSAKPIPFSHFPTPHLALGIH